MPPKKKEEPVEKAVLGRFRSNLKVRGQEDTLRNNLSYEVHSVFAACRSMIRGEPLAYAQQGMKACVQDQPPLTCCAPPADGDCWLA